MAARPTGGTAANRRRSLAVIVSKCKAAVGRRRSRGWSGFSGNRGHRFPPSSAAARAIESEEVETTPVRMKRPLKPAKVRLPELVIVPTFRHLF
uniref:Uncharacterized protein n=1 Tax=Oryza glumipatula TaxID=40148 RepID=A0A0E0B389_9ORYZ